MVDEPKKPKKTKKLKKVEETNVVSLFGGEMIPRNYPIDSEKAIKTILKEGGLKGKRFILITYPDNATTDEQRDTYYTSGDTLGNTNFEIDKFKLFLLGVME